MAGAYFVQQRDFYLKVLLQDTLPFWLKHGRDMEYGGYYTCLRRDGSVFDADKVSTWGQGRIAWAFAYVYNNLRPDPEWLSMAMHGVQFIKQFCVDGSGRLYGSVSRDGTPLAPAFDIYHDLFAAQAFGECAKAAGDQELMRSAKCLLFAVDDLLDRPEANPYRLYNSALRPMSHHPEHLIVLETAQLLRALDNDPRYDEIAAKRMDRILSLHCNNEARAVLELVRTDGGPLPRWIGRSACPGHMLELAWMLVREGQHRRKDAFIEKGIEITDWAMEWGWNKEHGGIINDISIDGEYCLGPRSFPYGPLILWWQMLEAIHANLQAYCVSRQPRFLERYEMVRDWSFSHFADSEYGEWYGILSPEGRLIDGGAKATDIKSCQHTVRTFYHCYRLMEREAANA